MKPVSKDEFYAVMNPLDAHPSIQPGPWPYTSLWKLRNSSRDVIGKSVCRGSAQGGGSDYFLADGA